MSKTTNFYSTGSVILCGHCGNIIKTMIKIIKNFRKRIITMPYIPPTCTLCGKNPQTSTIKKLKERKVYHFITLRFNYSSNISNGPIKFKNVRLIRKKQQLYLIIKRASRTQNISDTCFSIGEGTEVLEYKE